MNIDEILDMLDELLDRAWNLPLSGGRCVIDAEKVREMVDDIRLNLPDEIKQAKAIVKDRSEILSSAKTEAEAIVRKAEERARVMIAQDEVMKQAPENPIAFSMSVVAKAIFSTPGNSIFMPLSSDNAVMPPFSSTAFTCAGNFGES